MARNGKLTPPQRLACTWCSRYPERRALTVVSCDQCGWSAKACVGCDDPWAKALLGEQHEKQHTAATIQGEGR